MKFFDLILSPILAFIYKNINQIHTSAKNIVVIIEEIKGDLAKTAVKLRMGEVKTKVKTERRMKANFEIVTPTSTVRVRGTEFLVNYDEDAEITTVEVFEGDVEVSDENGFGTAVTSEKDIVEVDTAGIIIYVSEGEFYHTEYGGIEEGTDNTFFLILCCTILIFVACLVVSIALMIKKKYALAVLIIFTTLILSCLTIGFSYLVFGYEEYYDSESNTYSP